MFISVFTDEIGEDALEAIRIIKSWGIDAVDFRGRVCGKGIEFPDEAQLVCDGRRSQATLDAMYRSAYDHDGGWVEVDVA